MASDVTIPGKTSNVAKTPAKTGAAQKVSAVSTAAKTSGSKQKMVTKPVVAASTAPVSAAKVDAIAVEPVTEKAIVEAVKVEAPVMATPKAPIHAPVEAKPAKIETVEIKSAAPKVAVLAPTPIDAPTDALRGIAEQSLAQARTAFTKSQEATESFAKGLETSGDVVQSGLKEIQLRMAEAMEAQSQATFGFFRAMTKVNTLSEAIELQSSEVRRSFERTLGEAKEISSLAQAMASKAAEPVRKAFDHALNSARVGH
jgi:hypothetical protein